MRKGILIVFSLFVTGADAGEPAPLRQFKNVIVMIPDGCANPLPAIARWCRGEANTLDGLLAGSVRTFMFDSVVTDSAAAGTALATGHKTSNGFVSVGPRSTPRLHVFEAPPNELQYRPLATVLEGAKRRGKAVGLVVTCSVAHATPAAFASHVHSRGLMNDIMEQLVYQDLDVVFGGGRNHLLPQGRGGVRPDGEDLRQVLRDRGYAWVENREELGALAPPCRAWGIFAGDSLEPALNRPTTAPRQPTLAEMTAKAIEILSRDPDGFFLMVEGSQVDWGCHANDPAYAVNEFIAFDEAVKAALRFAEGPGRGETLLIGVPDHGTGGVSLGSGATEGGYWSLASDGPLARMKITAAGLARAIPSSRDPKDASKRVYRAENVSEAIAAWWPMFGIDRHGKASPPPETAVKEVLALYASGRSLESALLAAVARKYTYVGWTTTGHTGDDVPLWVFGADSIRGQYDNTDVARLAAEALGVSLPAVTEELFVDAADVFAGEEWSLVWDIDVPDDPATKDKNEAFRDNAVLVVARGDRRCRVPVNKNVVQFASGGVLEEHAAPGVTVYAPEREKAKLCAKPAVYLSREAAGLIAQFLQHGAAGS